MQLEVEARTKKRMIRVEDQMHSCIEYEMMTSGSPDENNPEEKVLACM